MAVVEDTPGRVKTLLTSFLQSSAAELGASNQSDPSPKASLSACQPRSKEAFWTRVETFSPFTWFAKPLELSPLYCSLYGWENVDVDILRCVSCKACIDATMPSNWDPEIFTKSCQNLKDSLITGHTKLCPWPDNPCPDAFVQLPMYTQDQWKKDFVVRWHSLLSLGVNLPVLDDIAYSDMDEVTDEHVAGLQQLFQTDGNELVFSNETQSTRQVIKISSLIALCGWNNRNSQAEAEHSTLFCTMCRRELGLWNFKPLKASETEENLPDSSLQRSKSTAKHLTEGRFQQSPQEFESMDMTQQTSSSSVSIEDETENIRTFAGVKRTNKGYMNTPLSGSTPSIDIEECMDIEEKLKLKADVKDVFMQRTDPEEPHMNLSETNIREAPRESLLLKRLVSGRDSPIRGKLNTEGLPYRSPLHSSISDLSEKGHCESLCVEVEDESLTEKLQAVESELEFMAGQSTTDREDYAPDIKRIRLEDLEQTKFNPLSEHRSWCPWVTCVITEKTHNTSESVSGWRMLLHTVLPSFYPEKIQSFTNVPPRDAWKPVKLLLNECTSSP